MYHIPVLKDKVIDLLSPKPGKTYVDCTLGGGGHGEAILKKAGGSCRLIGIDMDPDAIAASKKRLKEFKNVLFVQDNFINIGSILEKKVEGILLDLGVSSHQFDTPERGFSIRFDGPLDMRMDKGFQISALDIVNKYDAEEIANIIYKYGEDRLSRRIARRIVEYREKQPILTTGQLSEIVKKSTGRFDCVIRTFQALRIAVNNELENLHFVLSDSISLLKKNGILIVISYHSLEDRIAKQAFKKYFDEKKVKILTKKPICAGEEEVGMNPRSRSAKLRAVLKV